MRLHSSSIALPLLVGFTACSSARVASPRPVREPAPAGVEGQPAAEASLDALEERSEYAALGEQDVEALARAAQARWPQRFSGFAYQRVETFSAGGVSHWMSIWLHEPTGLEFVLVPGGEFRMGSPVSEAGRKDDELQHVVRLDPFLIARTECSQGAWAKLSREADPEGDSPEAAADLPQAGKGPVEVETWCRTAGLTLPTEAQWEFMCRAGTTSAWAMGAEKSELVGFGNLGSAECPQGWVEMPGITEPWNDGFGARAAPVGSFSANAFGLFDVHGNLSEWCRDHYIDYEMPATEGTGERPGISGERMARGGNFGCDASVARSAARFKCGSGISPGANKGFGFRPALDLPFRLSD